jgi:dTMP kinase
MTGLFVTMEGVEGSGKSTQIALLADYLTEQGYEVVVTREPGGTPLAERIRDLLMEPSEETMAPLAELLLYEAARAQHVQTVILPALSHGKVVLCDRYVDSTTAYQGAGRQLDEQVVEELNRWAAGRAWPDITFLLDLPAEEGLLRARRRGSDDRMMKETLEFHRRIREGFLAIAQHDPDRITIVGGAASADEIHRQMRNRIATGLKTMHARKE